MDCRFECGPAVGIQDRLTVPRERGLGAVAQARLVREALTTSARALAGGHDAVGAGLVDAERALARVGRRASAA